MTKDYCLVRAINTRKALEDKPWDADEQRFWLQAVNDLYRDVLQENAGAELLTAAHEAYKGGLAPSTGSVSEATLYLMSLAIVDHSEDAWPYIKIADWLDEHSHLPRDKGIERIWDLAQKEYGW
jgi:hypothetical protein